MPSPAVLLMVAALAGGVYTYTEYVKPAAVKVAHVVKTGASKVGHGLLKVVGR